MSEKEKAAIEAVYNHELKVGDVWYLISSKWWDQWKEYARWGVEPNVEEGKEDEDPSEPPRTLNRSLSCNRKIHIYIEI